MPIHLTLTPDRHVGECSQCGAVDVAVYSYFVEAGECSGETPPLCESCLHGSQGGSPIRTVLEDPPKERGAKPPSRHLRKLIQKEERQTATMVGGHAQKASGAMASDKGDIRVKGKLRGEEKSTAKASFNLKRVILDKIRGECVGRERPFLLLRFRNPTTLATEDRWVIIPVEDWEHNQHASAQH